MRDWEQGKQRIRLGEVPVEKVRLDLKSRDDIPAVLRGLQALYCDPRMRKRLFELLESALGSDRDLGNGRPGMPMWSMVVLAVLKEGLNCDWDRLHELVNRHGTVREMLGGFPFWRATILPSDADRQRLAADAGVTSCGGGTGGPDRTRGGAKQGGRRLVRSL